MEVDTDPTIRQSYTMNPVETVKEIKRRVPLPPKPRAERGVWITHAWAVRILVEREHWNVSDAVRQVVDAQKLHPPDQAFAGIRAAYYEVLKKDWPENLRV